MHYLFITYALPMHYLTMLDWYCVLHVRLLGALLGTVLRLYG